MLPIVPSRYFCGGSFCFVSWCLKYLVKTENEKRRSVMKVQAFCEEKGLRSFLGVFGYAES